MAANHFDSNLILDQAVGTAAAPGAYFGWGIDTSDEANSAGPRIYCGTGAGPSGTVTAPLASLWIRQDAGNVGLYILTVAPNTWALVP